MIPASRDERHLMRRRGAGIREVIHANFGFTFGSFLKTEISTGAESASHTAPVAAKTSKHHPSTRDTTCDPPQTKQDHDEKQIEKEKGDGPISPPKHVQQDVAVVSQRIVECENIDEIGKAGENEKIDESKVIAPVGKTRPEASTAVVLVSKKRGRPRRNINTAQRSDVVPKSEELCSKSSRSHSSIEGPSKRRKIQVSQEYIANEDHEAPKIPLKVDQDPLPTMEDDVKQGFHEAEVAVMPRRRLPRAARPKEGQLDEEKIVEIYESKRLPKKKKAPTAEGQKAGISTQSETIPTAQVEQSITHELSACPKEHAEVVGELFDAKIEKVKPLGQQRLKRRTKGVVSAEIDTSPELVARRQLMHSEVQAPNFEIIRSPGSEVPETSKAKPTIRPRNLGRRKTRRSGDVGQEKVSTLGPNEGLEKSRVQTVSINITECNPKKRDQIEEDEKLNGLGGEIESGLSAIRERNRSSRTTSTKTVLKSKRPVKRKLNTSSTNPEESIVFGDAYSTEQITQIHPTHRNDRKGLSTIVEETDSQILVPAQNVQTLLDEITEAIKSTRASPEDEIVPSYEEEQSLGTSLQELDRPTIAMSLSTTLPLSKSEPKRRGRPPKKQPVLAAKSETGSSNGPTKTKSKRNESLQSRRPAESRSISKIIAHDSTTGTTVEPDILERPRKDDKKAQNSPNLAIDASLATTSREEEEKQNVPNTSIKRQPKNMLKAAPPPVNDQPNDQPFLHKNKTSSPSLPPPEKSHSHSKSPPKNNPFAQTPPSSTNALSARSPNPRLKRPADSQPPKLASLKASQKATSRPRKRMLLSGGDENNDDDGFTFTYPEPKIPTSLLKTSKESWDWRF